MRLGTESSHSSAAAMLSGLRTSVTDQSRDVGDTVRLDDLLFGSVLGWGHPRSDRVSRNL